MLPEDVVTIAMSDHGARPMMGGLCFNDWLIQEGYLVLKEPVREITPIAKADVDWSRTVAWGDGGYYGRCFLNIKGREPNGIVEPARYETLRNEMVAKLEALPGPDGLPMGTKVHKPQEVYPEVRGVAPDLIVYFGDLDWRSVGAVGEPQHLHVRERHRHRRRQSRPRRLLLPRQPARAANRQGGRPEPGRRGPVDPVPLRHRGAGRRRRKELPEVTEHEQQGFTVWFTGLSGSGKSTIAEMLYHEFQARGLKTEILDGDEVRKNPSKGLGFSKEDRDTNIMRIGYVANLLTRNGVVTICCPISPYKETRDACRELIGEFVEVYIHATVDEIAANRDPKGLYKKALAGEITGFTGVDDPYEAPEEPEIRVDTLSQTPEESLQHVMTRLKELGRLGDDTVHVTGDRCTRGLPTFA